MDPDDPRLAYGRPSQNDPQVRSQYWQDVLNASWPFHDKNGDHARGIPDQENPIPVQARLVFETDGEVFLDGLAVRWTKTHVRVQVDDRRLQIRGVWVKAEDVRRR